MPFMVLENTPIEGVLVAADDPKLATNHCGASKTEKQGELRMQTDLSQTEADALLRMEKFRVDNTSHAFPDFGGHIQIELQSENQRETFSLDISRRKIALTTKYQTRARQAVVLARLDFNSPHRNPDDTEVGVPHLHLYREGFGDKWAIEVPAGMLNNVSDTWQVLVDFMAFCKIKEPPVITRGLFT